MDICEVGKVDKGSLGVPSLMSELPERVTRSRRVPERYNPASGRSYGTRIACHHIQTQRHPVERTLLYEKGKVKVVATIMNCLKEQCNSQLFNLKKGLKEFAAKGVAAAKSELSQMHDRSGFRAISVAELSRRETLRAQEGLMLLTRKKSGEAKG